MNSNAPLPSYSPLMVAYMMSQMSYSYKIRLSPAKLKGYANLSLRGKFQGPKVVRFTFDTAFSYPELDQEHSYFVFLQSSFLNLPTVSP